MSQSDAHPSVCKPRFIKYDIQPSLLTGIDPQIDLKLTPPSAAGRIHVGFSGGLDSTVLLHMLAARFPRRVHAVHVHHGLQPAADEWSRHCAEFCAERALAFSSIRVRVDANCNAGPEAAARQTRYEALRQLMTAGDCLATAHHRDDQAETVLLRLLRGTGVHGLAGMRACVEFAPGWLWRPLLDTPRAELQRYAETQGLRWIDDPHNADARYTRSWLRAEVLPILQQRFPAAPRSLARAAILAAEASELLDELASMDLAIAAQDEGLRATALLKLSAPRRHNLLRFWLRGQGFEVPSADELALITGQVLRAADDAAPRFAWRDCELRRYRDLLFAMPPLQDVPEEWTAIWSENLQLQLPAGCGRLEADRAPAHPLTVRLPRTGESFKPRGSAHTRTLKNLFQEAGTPPWVRLRTPVIESAGVVVAIAGLGVSESLTEHRQAAFGALRWHHGLNGAASPLAL